MDGCIHHLDICEQCGGLEITDLTPLNMAEGSVPAGTRLYWTAGPPPCDADDTVPRGADQ